MAERPRGRGRIGNRGRGRGRGGPRTDRTNDGFRDVPWRILLGYKRLQELKEKEANEIILTLSKRKNAFKEALDEPQHDDEMVALFLRCISKACECETLRQTMIELFVIFENSSFFKSSLPSYIYTVQSETGNYTQMKYQQPLRDILIIVKEFRLRMPQSILAVIGLNSILGSLFQTLRENSSPVLDDDMWDSYIEYKESQEEALKRRAAKKMESKREVDNEDDPPDDFRELKVFPEKSDVQMDANPFVRRNKKIGSYENLDHYLDVQFRLLREDFIGPLRDGITDYMETMHDTGKAKRLQELRIYSNVKILSPVCNSKGLCRRLSFYCKGMDRIRWESSKRLIYGSLVCLSSDNFQTLLFATVTDRELKNIRKGHVDVKFETDNRTVASLPNDTVFVMAETTAYFESYRHVLHGLQNVHAGDMPFEKYIVRCFPEMELPTYLRRNQDAVFDLRPLVDDDMIIRGRRNIPGNREGELREPTYNFSIRSQDARHVKVDDLKSWPAPDLFHLDMSQFRAVQNALSREFAIIQGPPGTGKTYIGLKVVKALLHNQHLWNRDPNTGAEDNRPLLVVCYTNHALDQFLEGILNFFKGDVLRLGSRSSSDIMKQLSISAMRMTMRKRREVPREIHLGRMQTKHTMKALQDEINKICERVVIAKREILHEDTLEVAMGKFYSRLNTGFDHRMNEMYENGVPWNSKKRHSALLEWLGYGEMFIVEEAEQQQAPNVEQGQQNVIDVQEAEENQDELIDEFINVIDELDAEMNMRQLDIDDEEFEDENDALVNEMQQALNDLDVRRPVIALDVSQLDADDKDNTFLPGQWQMSRKQKKKMKKTIRKELDSSDRMNAQEVFRIFDMWNLSQKDRWRLYRFWVHTYCNSLQEKIRGKEETFQQTCEQYNEVLMQEDREIMRHSTIIGVTTTCAARYQSVLQEIGPRVIVVEEAAEVLEAHIITTLSRRCEHLILIGDHQQLKPNPTVYKLATKYNLEISLFERMICNKMEYDCLMYQHRMRQDISKLMKKIYPNLRDDDAVLGHEDVKGVASNVFFIDHTHAESSEEDLKSHSNEHEAEYTVALCRYLLLQGYEPEQITVLTLYSGQLFALRRKMPKSLYEGVRVTVVDNYQGEENDIVLLSLVRSNEDGKIGFLSIENRVCVALSRAKIGLYVIGNFTLLSDKSRLWSKMVDHARQHNFIGEGLPLYCQNHPNDAGVRAIAPSDFKKAPEGGCMKACEYRLPCGHTCARACHTYDRDHEEYECNKPCTKYICERKHRCSRRCNQECGRCHELVPKVLPKCGHTEDIPCSLDPTNWRCASRCRDTLPCGHPCRNLCGEAHTEFCQTRIMKRWDCGHSAKVYCAEQATAVCTEHCSKELECGHLCSGTCGKCFQGRLHVFCTKQCQRPLVCEHPCQDRCTSNCPPCRRQCENRCKHSYCGQKCGNVCVPCSEMCEWRCRHYRCKKVCSEPCERPRCNEPCRVIIDCGHPCIGLCGEPCPTLCRICNRDIVTEVFFGNEDEPDARFVQLEDCGHVFEYSDLDQWMDKTESESNDSAIKLKECPRCKTAIRRNLRYGNLIKQALRDIEMVKKRMLGDENRKRELEYSITRGLPDLPTKDAKRIREFMMGLTKGPVDENALVAVENQVHIIKLVNELKLKFVKDKTTAHYQEMYRTALEHLDAVYLFTIRHRMYFTTQETSDVTSEVERLRRLCIFMKYKERRRQTESTISRELSRDFMTTEQYLIGGGRINPDRITFIDRTIEALKNVIPLSGLSVTEQERVQIVKAIGLGQGHWFKCPNGHIYAIGDCGQANQRGICPECKSRIGGMGQLQAGNTSASEMTHR